MALFACLTRHQSSSSTGVPWFDSSLALLACLRRTENPLIKFCVGGKLFSWILLLSRLAKNWFLFSFISFLLLRLLPHQWYDIFTTSHSLLLLFSISRAIVSFVHIPLHSWTSLLFLYTFSYYIYAGKMQIFNMYMYCVSSVHSTSLLGNCSRENKKCRVFKLGY